MHSFLAAAKDKPALGGCQPVALGPAHPSMSQPDHEEHTECKMCPSCNDKEVIKPIIAIQCMCGEHKTEEFDH